MYKRTNHVLRSSAAASDVILHICKNHGRDTDWMYSLGNIFSFFEVGWLIIGIKFKQCST